MRKLKSLSEKLYNKQISNVKMIKIAGGLTLTGCCWTASEQAHDCTSFDDDKPTQQLEIAG